MTTPDTAPEPPVGHSIGFTLGQAPDGRDVCVFLDVATAGMAVRVQLTVDEAAQLLAQIPTALGGAVSAARQHKMGLVIAPATIKKLDGAR